MTSSLKKISITVLTLAITSAISLILLAPAAYGVTTDDLLPRPGEKESTYATENIKKYEELGTVADLPEVTDTALMTTIIKTILGWAMLLTIAGIVVASVYYLTSRGKEEDVTKAKDILLYLVVGMAIMAAAYGIVSGIAQFEFF
jgi:Na+-translocating ferredoxin:NAD+ oxidoreductase RnfG subunit